MPQNDLLIMEAEGFRRELLELPDALSLDDDVRAVWDYWHQLKGDRIGPSRTEIDPSQIKRQLPGILMYDVLREPLRFRYRLSGTYSDRIHGKSVKGNYVDEMQPPEFGTTLHADFALLTETFQPQFADVTFTNAGGNRREFQVIRLPLSDDGKAVHHIFAFTTFTG